MNIIVQSKHYILLYVKDYGENEHSDASILRQLLLKTD